MKKIIQVPYISQSVLWPTGCESVSTVMLLRYFGVELSVDDFIAVLPKADLFEKGGTTYGPSPNRFFVGSPYDEKALGCYPGVIVQTVNRLALERGLGLRAKDISGMPFSELISQYLLREIPVLLWATMDMKQACTGPSWTLTDSDETFTWKSNEHCLCLVGFDEDGYYLNDPWENHGCIRYEKSLVEKRHSEQYAMAAVIERISG